MYTILKHIGDRGLRTRHDMYGEQRWLFVPLRKYKTRTCAMCGAPLGKEAFRPLTELRNRNDRICDRH